MTSTTNVKGIFDVNEFIEKRIAEIRELIGNRVEEELHKKLVELGWTPPAAQSDGDALPPLPAAQPMVPEGLCDPVAGAKIHAHFAASAQTEAGDGWQRMTEAVRDLQRRHIDNHQGDVYHAMQSLAVKFGAPRTGPMFQDAPAQQPAAPTITDEMVERACKKYAFREDGATWPDAYSENEVRAERVLMREFLAHAIGAPAQPAAGELGADGIVIAFGHAHVMVSEGTGVGRPSVFLHAAQHAGDVGDYVPTADYPYPAPITLTFPTAEQAKRVADALVNAPAQHPAAPDGLHGWKCNCCDTVFTHTQAERKDDTNGGATCPYCKAHGQYTYPYRLHNGDPCTGCGKPHDAVTVGRCPGGVGAPAPLPAAQSGGGAPVAFMSPEAFEDLRDGRSTREWAFATANSGEVPVYAALRQQSPANPPKIELAEDIAKIEPEALAAYDPAKAVGPMLRFMRVSDVEPFVFVRPSAEDYEDQFMRAKSALERLLPLGIPVVPDGGKEATS